MAEVDEVARLREANELLSRFVGAAAHDIQEPLRLLAGYLDLIEFHLERHAVDDAAGLVREAAETAERMQALVQGVLEIVRIEHAAPPKARVPLDAALDDAMKNVRLRLAESGARVDRDRLPTVRGDRVQLALVFQNLVENCLKHCPPDRIPLVRVSATREPGGWTVNVDDNGAGWPTRGRASLFQPFAHLNEAAPGTGLGLAMVRAIIARHGGGVAALDAPGGGARVEIHFPRQP